MNVFGPVPSRRLGSSLGINNIPPKHCTYSCVYCQVGRTTTLETARRPFWPPGALLDEAARKIDACAGGGQALDYLTLVPDGEPTLDSNLERLVEGLKPFGYPVAVISNGALIDRADVQQALMAADWVSLKVDAVREDDWRRINRPHHRLSLAKILDGMRRFRGRFCGELVTETMLVSGLNDIRAAIEGLCDYLLALQPFRAYLSIPTRPPAETWVRPPDDDALRRILRDIAARVPFVDVLFEPEAAGFTATGDLAEDIMGITAVHPMREDALRSMVQQAGGSWAAVETLLARRQLTRVQYRGEHFYRRRFSA